MKEIIKEEIAASANLKFQLLSDDLLQSQLENLVNACIIALQQGGKIIFCGNGGSFADAQHLSAELISRLRFDRPALASIALGTNNSNLSAIGNDYGFEDIFSREVAALGNAVDVFIPISTSGNSPNVIKAIEIAKEKGLTIVGFTGMQGGKMAALCDCIRVPNTQTDKIQEVQIMLGHILCHLMERRLFGQRSV